MRVLVLGAGKMVRAVLKGLQKTTDFSQWYLYSPSGVSAQKLAHEVGAQWVENLSKFKEADFILVGCKPQQLHDASNLLHRDLRCKIFLSLLALLKENEQRAILQVGKLIRLMPNMPIEYKIGVLLVCSESAPERVPEIINLFSSCARVVSLKEKEFEELTLLSGSGPALFYQFGEYLLGSFESLSFEEREIILKEVLIGVGITLEHRSQTLKELTLDICSKKGVTEKVLKNWECLGFDQLIKRSLIIDKN